MQKRTEKAAEKDTARQAGINQKATDKQATHDAMAAAIAEGKEIGKGLK